MTAVLEIPELIGFSEPRIATPVRGNPVRGAEAIAFATDVLGVDLMDWQKTLLDRACRTDERGRWQYRSVLCLVSRQQGKSFVTACRILAGLMLWGEKLAIASASSRDIALELFRTALELAEDAELPIERVRKAVGSEEVAFEGGGRYKVVSATSRGSRGLSADLVVVDEMREHKTFAAYDGLEKTRRARPSSQLWAISSEGTYESVVLDLLAKQGRAAAAAGTHGPLCFLEWSAAPELDRADPLGWQQANPALGRTLERSVLEAELLTDEPESFERECLNRRTSVARSWLPAGVWEACTDGDAAVPDDAAGAVAFGIDASPDLQHSAIAVAWQRPDGRTHCEAVATFHGSEASSAAETFLCGLCERWQPRRLAVLARGPAEPVAGRVGAVAAVEVDAVTGTNSERAGRSFYEAAVSRRVTHPADPVLADALASAEGGEPGTLALRRRNAALDITPAVAAILAVWAVDKAPVVAAAQWVAW